VTARAKQKPTNRADNGATVALPAMGIEAEFAVVLDGTSVRPEDLFGSPKNIVRTQMMHRTGRSYHLPTGNAIYFDTGVIEIATPVIEIERRCAARAGRSLWESIDFVRRELDAWEEREHHVIDLAGFSTHYNVSFEIPTHERGNDRSAEQLALLLTHMLPIPVMLLAANRRSTGIGVRPRANRIEVTADFTPDAALMIATATLIVGIARAVMTWPTFTLGNLESVAIPVVADFTPEAHRSRTGWVARFSSFAENPFVADADAPMWTTRDGETRSLRGIAHAVTRYFWPSIAAIGDTRSLRLISAVMHGKHASLLELDDRPPSYERVGRLCRWGDLFPESVLPRSRYERVLIRAVSRRPLLVDGDRYTPTGVDGWSHVVYQRDADRARRRFSLDELLAR